MEFLSWAVEKIIFFLNEVRLFVNDACIGLEPWQIIAYTFAAIVAILWIHGIFDSDQSILTRIKRTAFRWIRKIPFIKQKIEAEVAKVRVEMTTSIHKMDTKKEFYKVLPEKGMSEKQVLAEADSYSSMGHYNYLGGQVSGTVYSGDPTLTDMLAKVFGKYAWSNPLHPDVFPGCRKMEAEVVRMVCNMFHGDENSCGTMTSGGTESLLLACLACRNRAYEMGNHEPEIVMPVTAHAAFEKAAHLYGMRIKHVQLDKRTMQVDIRAMRRAISSRTCMLVGSAPGFPYGIVDPIEEIAQLGLKKGIPVHVDSCLGGFLLPFMESCGYKMKPFDFRVPGVTSISCDTHKYGYVSKGSSVLMYRDKDLLHYQFFSHPDWPGGIYATPTLAGSRCGASIAVTWATMLYFGKQGYVEATRKIVEAAMEIRKAVEETEGLTLMGQPEVSVVAFTSSAFNIYALSDRMTVKGWHLNHLQFPPGIHFCATINHTKKEVVKKFVADLREEVAFLLNHPDEAKATKGTAVMYGSTQSIPDRNLISEMAFTFLDCCYQTVAPTAAPEKEKNGVHPTLLS